MTDSPVKAIHEATWQYAQTSHIAWEYDAFFENLPLFKFDTQIIDKALSPPGRVIDLGCGTGRHVVHLARKGFDVVGMDLSPFMLDVTRDKLNDESLDAELVNGTITDLSRFDDGEFDSAVCMFSTLGLVRGYANRLRFLREVRRILKPRGVIVLHVHNRFDKLRSFAGIRWLAKSYLLRPFRDLEVGDMVGEYRGILNMFLHSFTLGELRKALREAALDMIHLVPLNLSRGGPLRGRAFMSVRANGFIAVACRPE